jgi:hypothetical protein
LEKVAECKWRNLHLQNGESCRPTADSPCQ